LSGSSSAIEVHVPLLNEVGSIERLIHSFESQTFKDFSVFIHDNASDDGSTDLIRKITGSNPRYRHIVYPARKNAWDQGSRLIGYPKLARYVSIRSANDFLLPDYYGEIFEILESNSEVALAYSHGFEVPEGSAQGAYNPTVEIRTVGMDRVTAVDHITSRYTQSFSLWGTYRSSVYDSLTPIRCYGADHVLVAQVGLMGFIETTSKPLDVMVTRPRLLSSTATNMGLNGMWTSHHPELLSGMNLGSSYISPDVFTPFCSMIIGHLEMLRIQCKSDQELHVMSGIIARSLFQRFGRLVEAELARVTQLFPDFSLERYSPLGNLLEVQMELPKVVPNIRLNAIHCLGNLYRSFSSGVK
jgi:hypothetical protein